MTPNGILHALLWITAAPSKQLRILRKIENPFRGQTAAFQRRFQKKNTADLRTIHGEFAYLFLATEKEVWKFLFGLLTRVAGPIYYQTRAGTK